MEESEEQIIGRLRDSDQKAFRLLFKKYQPMLFRIVLHRIGDADAAHDIVQETFVRLWNHRGSLRPELPLLAYLLRISTNLVYDRAKHLNVRSRLETSIPATSPSGGDDPEEFAQLNMLEEKLAEVVRTGLPARCREVFLLSRMEGMSNAEIASRLGISPKTVENQITRALKILRRELARYLS
jgi:RNA polymerase sigma-70 factor (ECF subfamily)